MSNKTARTVYGIDGEIFNHDELDDAVNDELDNGCSRQGDIITIWQGTTVPKTAGDYGPLATACEMSEKAYDDCGEWADDWPYYTTKQGNELDEKIKAVINEWADAHSLHPNFYTVVDVVEIKVRILNDDCDWELVA